MSMNVRLGTETCLCGSIRQTPTEDTYEIVKSDDPMEAYFVWLRARIEEWKARDITNPHDDPDFDLESTKTYWDNDYERQTKAIRAYVEAHPTAEWTVY